MHNYPSWLYFVLTCDIANLSGDEISELNYELTQLQEARDGEKEMYEGQLEQLKTEFHDTKEQLTSENMILSEFRLFTLCLRAV